MFPKRYLIIISFFIFRAGFSQELVVPAFDNPESHSVQLSGKRLKSAPVQDTISLPFFDDFSGSMSPFPKSALWLDSFVFINDSRPVNPLSIGVATFDALDKKGKIYKHASNNPFIADVLTSKPLNMNYPVGSNAYLSFYYQPQGYGDSTEVHDSLMVDFYNPLSKRWWNVWRVKGSGLHPFKAAVIPVSADSFLVKGFQFRFRNYASIRKNNFDPGKMGDVDHWNIDYVKLDINRSPDDTIFHDVAFSKPVGSLLKNYQSMPWKQFQVAFQRVMRGDIDITYRNNDIKAYKPYRYFAIRDLRGTNVTSFSSGNDNIDPQQVYHFTTNLEYPFFTDQTDSALFEVKSYLGTESDDIKINDTTRFHQVFSNYFAYDDGTPEYGYGLSGQGTSGGMVAYGFTSYMPDSLSAVKIFFNSTIRDTTKSFSFQLTVWDAGTSGPGNVIYRSGLVQPAELGKFTTYILDSSLLINGDFYVGWRQPDENFLNVGLDRNNAATDKLFFNTGAWQKSTFDNASLMIRPVFGSRKFLTKKNDIIEAGDYRIYPNPTAGRLHISKPDDKGGRLFITLMNMTGKMMMHEEVHADVVELGNFPSGVYFIILTDSGKVVYKNKVIVQH